LRQAPSGWGRRPNFSVDALKQTLLNAKSIVYADPAKGGAAGVYFAHVVDRLGIVMSKTILVPGAQAADMVASGEAEIGVGQTSEIVPVAGAQVLGPLPGELASTTVFTGGIRFERESGCSKVVFAISWRTGRKPVLNAKGFHPG
jgi:molybdate transport system substrate-binding protein